MTELYINGKLADVGEDIDITIEKILFDVTKAADSNGEFSYTFRLPLTRENNIAFGYANITSQHYKYGKRYGTALYQDGRLLFEGSALLRGISADGYEINLVNNRVNTIDSIFGDELMNSLVWKMEYDGYETINAINAEDEPEVCFPLVSYGVFQKKPEISHTGGYEVYNSIYALDNKYTLWYEDTFIPTFNYLALIRRLFEEKGYRVEGDIFNDDAAKKIYLSNYIESTQVPVYNLGNRFGTINLGFSFTNKEGGASVSDNYITQSLDFPYERVNEGTYNLDTVRTYDITAFGNISHNNPRLFRENMIYVPSDGLYSIGLQYTVDISGAPSTMDVYKYRLKTDVVSREIIKTVEMYQETIARSFDAFPVEIQLVRNTDDVEMIYNKPTVSSPYSLYPHEAEVKNGSRLKKSDTGVRRPNIIDYGDTVKDGEMIAYDPFASPNFICGGSTSGNGHGAVIKNGGSWNREIETRNYSRFKQDGYWHVKQQRTQSGYQYTLTKTDYNSNTLPNSTYSVTVGDGTMTFNVECIVALSKDDKISLKAVTREYTILPDTEQSRSPEAYSDDYKFTVQGNLTFKAYSPKTSSIINRSDIDYLVSPFPFDTLLNLSEFLNENQTKTDFISNFMNIFNLSFSENDGTVTFSKQKNEDRLKIESVNIDRKIISSESEYIDYPKSLAVKFSINDSESGFYRSVPEEYIEDADWKNHAYLGYEEIDMKGDIEAEEKNVSLSMSYDWFSDFVWKRYSGDEVVEERNLRLPLIAQDSYFIEGGDIGEYMKHDGRSLKQRMFFYGTETIEIPLTYVNGSITARIPEEYYYTSDNRRFDLTYDNHSGSMLDRYYNIQQNPSVGYEIVECRITVDDFIRIRNGATVKYNGDIYRCSRVQFSLNGESKVWLLK